MRILLSKLTETLPLEPNIRLMRTGMLATELLRRGHEVIWVTSAFNHRCKTWYFSEETRISPLPGLTILALRGCGYRKNVSIARYIDHRLIARRFRQLVAQLPRPDVAVASLPCPNMAYETVRFAQAADIPCLVDIRDPWPDNILDYLPRPLRPGLRLALHGDFHRTKWLLRYADAVIAVSRTFLEWGQHKADRSPCAHDQVVYLGYPQPERTEDLPIPDWLAAHAGKRLAVFVGSFGRSYELTVVVQAARRFQKAGIQDVLFVFAGDGEQMPAMQQRTQGMANVVLLGWQERRDIAALLSRAAVGIAPCRMARGTMPNKIFEYMAFGLPLVSSLQGDMETLLATEGMGLSYAPGDVQGLVAALHAVLDDPQRQAAMRAASAAFFATNGDIRRIMERYAALIETLGAA